MKSIIISPYSRALRNGKVNSKNLPKDYWLEIITKLKEHDILITQIGRRGEEKIVGVDEYKFDLPLKDLGILVNDCDSWISVDNFWHHFAWLHNKPGVVVFSQSDPVIFGHTENINLLKDRKYLRKDQFGIWESVEPNDEAFVSPQLIVDATLRRLQI